MKLPITIISMLALSSALTLTPRDAADDPVIKYGDLGVMAVDTADFPADTLDTNTRPLEPRSDGLTTMSCFKDEPYGCSGGYCWKACRNMNKCEWCWTAKEGGWIKCSGWQDCGTTTYACARGVCPPCGG